MMTEYDFDPYPIRPEPRLWSLYGYWRRRRSVAELFGTGIERSRTAHARLGRWRRNLMLIRFYDDVTTYEVEWEGAGLRQYYGSDRAGHGVETLTAMKERDLLIGQYGAVLASRRPAYFESAFTNSDGVFAHQTKLILPLSTDQERVDRVLVGIYFRGMNNIVDIIGKLNDLAEILACPIDAPSRITRRLAAIAARRDHLNVQLRNIEKRAAALGLAQVAAKVRTILFIIADMLVLEGRMVEAGPSWPWDETLDDLHSLFDFGLSDVMRADLADVGDAMLLAKAVIALEDYRDSLLAVAV